MFSLPTNPFAFNPKEEADENWNSWDLVEEEKERERGKENSLFLAILNRIELYTGKMSLTWLVFLTHMQAHPAKPYSPNCNWCLTINSVGQFSMERSSVWSGRNRKFPTLDIFSIYQTMSKRKLYGLACICVFSHNMYRMMLKMVKVLVQLVTTVI